MTSEGQFNFTRRGFLTATSVAALSAAGLAAGAAPAHAQDTYQVSTGWADITPPVGYPMGGYAELHISEGVNEPLKARCTIIWDAGVPNIIVTADVLGFGRGLHQQIRAGVVGMGVNTSDFVLTATHTHKGPALVEVLDPYISYGISETELEAYSSDLVAIIVNLVGQTMNAGRTSCTLDYQVLSADFSTNRAGLGYVERDVPVLVARDLDGNPRTVLFSFGTHPVASGNNSSYFDPDYPSEAIKTIEALGANVHAQFILGPAGDQNPINSENVLVSDAFGAALGTTIAKSVTTPGRPIGGPIRSTLLERNLPLEIDLSPGNLAAVRNAYLDRANSHPTAYVRRHASSMVERLDRGQLETTVPLPIQAWNFLGEAGDATKSGLSIVFCGGEVVSGYGVYFRNNYGGTRNLWFTAYANEVPCYIPSDEVLGRGGYEAGIDTGSYPGIAGHSMCVYGHMAHLRGRTSSTQVPGVEQVVIEGIRAALAGKP